MKMSFQNVKIICPKILTTKLAMPELKLEELVEEYPHCYHYLAKEREEIIISSDVNKILKETTTNAQVKYDAVFSTGESSNVKCQLNLQVIEESGNYLVHRDVIRYHNSRRQGTVSTRTRSEVKGGGRKPWKQKGTGRARAGSNRSPLWKGGGVIFGPTLRNRKYKLNKKEHRLALQTLLYNKRNSIFVVNSLEEYFRTPKTKEFYKICKNCNINLNQRILIIVAHKTLPLKLSLRNIENINLISSEELNVLSLIKADQIILTPLAMAKINNFNIINYSTKRGGVLRLIFNNDINRINEFVNDYIESLNDHDIYKLCEGGFL